jgi:hypothetical protein
MGLMQLLSVGQTIKGTREGPNNFRMNEQTLLPKFTSRAPRSAEAPQPESSGVMTTGSLFDEKRPRRAAPGVTVLPSTERAPSVFTRTQSPVKPIERKSRWSFFKRLFRRKHAKNSFGIAIQTEWKLETIRVVRNDLSDSDLELIPSRGQPAPVPEAVLAPAPAPEAGVQPFTKPQPAKGWGRIASRFFKRSRTQ